MLKIVISALVGLTLGVFVQAEFAIIEQNEHIRSLEETDQPEVTKAVDSAVASEKTKERSSQLPISSPALTPQLQPEGKYQVQIEELQEKLKRTELELEAYIVADAVRSPVTDNEEQILSFNESIDALLEPPFNQFMKGLEQHVAKPFTEFAEQQVDYAWADDIELKVRDALTQYERGHEISLSAVICKTNICHLYGFAEKPVWEAFLAEVSAQPWWSFHNSQSFHYNGSSGSYFYYIANKKA